MNFAMAPRARQDHTYMYTVSTFEKQEAPLKLGEAMQAVLFLAMGLKAVFKIISLTSSTIIINLVGTMAMRHGHPST